MSKITPEFVAEALRADIADGRLRPGVPLRQEQLADRFHVSRIPIREALRQLEAEGLVVVQANRGASVRSFTVAELREIYDLRILLECDLLERAVANMGDAEVDRVELEVQSLHGRVPAALWRTLDRRFHLALYEPASRPQQLELVMRLRNSIEHYSPADAHLRTNAADWMADHRDIAQACSRKDASRAVQLLRDHLSTAAELTLSNVQVG